MFLYNFLFNILYAQKDFSIHSYSFLFFLYAASMSLDSELEKDFRLDSNCRRERRQSRWLNYEVKALYNSRNITSQ